MATIERSFFVEVPQEQIFAFLTDHANDLQWLPGLTDARNFTGEGTDYRWEMTYKMAGISFNVTGQVVNTTRPGDTSSKREAGW